MSPVLQESPKLRNELQTCNSPATFATLHHMSFVRFKEGLYVEHQIRADMRHEARKTFVYTRSATGITSSQLS